MSAAAYISIVLYVLGVVLAEAHAVETKSPRGHRWWIVGAWPIYTVALIVGVLIEVRRARRKKG